jgi:hypothetical protein
MKKQVLDALCEIEQNTCHDLVKDNNLLENAIRTLLKWCKKSAISIDIVLGSMLK